MQKITTLDEIKTIPDAALREHIWNQTSEMMAESAVNALDEIGCIVLLNSDERDQFLDEGMEFVERVVLAGIEYLHGVRILGDCYGEDVYLMVKEVEHHV